MSEFKLEYTEPDMDYTPQKEDKPQYRYYEIGVSRRQITWINVRVPHDKELNMRNCHSIANDAVDKLVKSYDWDDEWPQDYDVESIKEVTESEALQYDVYEGI